MTDLIKGILGAVLLFFGRRLFWLFVGAVGFVAGLELGNFIFPNQPETTHLIVAVVFGIVGVLLAFFLQKIAVMLAGLIVGGLFVWGLLNVIGQQTHPQAWLFILIGAVIGAALVAGVFNWALMILSAVGGALLITQAVHLTQILSGLVFLGLLLVGFTFQARSYRRVKRH
jgi:hypothetical protein